MYVDEVRPEDLVRHREQKEHKKKAVIAAEKRAMQAKERTRLEEQRPELLEKLQTAGSLLADTIQAHDPQFKHAKNLTVYYPVPQETEQVPSGTFWQRLLRKMHSKTISPTTRRYNTVEVASWFIAKPTHADYSLCYVTRLGDIVGLTLTERANASAVGDWGYVPIPFDDLSTRDLDALLEGIATTATTFKIGAPEKE